MVVRKFDGAEHRRWSARLVDKSETLIVLDATFEEQIEHDLLGTIPLGTLSKEYYWLDRWYNVFRFHNSDGSVKNYYCNVNMPPEFVGLTLSYIDLDIDILVEPDFTYRVLDLADFEENVQRYNYPLMVREQAEKGLAELINLIETKAFPFS